ncbi:MAG TPA: MBL fold metallo-hydrolase [Acidimicrobiia bacterium]|nr:MBL fold metallo-hydrolase [Acidimicrobiia bacterium]
MKVVMWGTRGSQASPGPDTVRYGGNTVCVQVTNDAGQVLLIDAGTGIRRAGLALRERHGRVDVLLSHFHMDHVQGLGFFAPLYDPAAEVHLWGPSTPNLDVHARLTRYLSPPLFPVRLRDLPCNLHIHDTAPGRLDIPGFAVTAALICHPGPTFGYRVEADAQSLAYLSDHEPMLCERGFAAGPATTSGYDLAADVDLLLHDAQYSDAEYETRVGWGHSTLGHCLAFAAAVRARHLVPFHHDPSHDDALLDAFVAHARKGQVYGGDVIAGMEDVVVDVGALT